MLVDLITAGPLSDEALVEAVLLARSYDAEPNRPARLLCWHPLVWSSRCQAQSFPDQLSA